MTKDQSGKSRQKKVRQAQTAAELTALLVCSAIVLFMFGFSVYHAYATGDSPPTISAEAKFEEATRRGDRWVLPIEVTNESRPTAEEVIASVQVRKPGEQPEKKELRIEFLPEESRFTGYVTLPEKPGPDSVSVEIDSYKLP